MSQECHELSWRWKRPDRGREIRVRARMPGDGSADERQHATEVPAVERGEPRDARHAELEDRQAASRPKNPCKLPARDIGLLNIAHAERDRRRIGDTIRRGD